MTDREQQAIEASAAAMYEAFAARLGKPNQKWGSATQEARDSFLCDARAALAAYREVMGDGWQPIENAPKDEDVLVSYPLCVGGPTIGVFDSSGWFHERTGDCQYRETDAPPTHWMPLPAPSTDAAPAAGGGE